MVEERRIDRWEAPDLQGRVVVVAGATRGCGREIAVSFGEAGATVYCTGRSVRGAPATGLHRPEGRPETIEETAELVSARGRGRGGAGVAVRVDHTRPDEVAALFERVGREQDGRLDVLVNDVWGGDELADWKAPFWEQSLEDGLRMQERAVWSHLITSRFGAPLLVTRGRGLIVEVTDGLGYGYRGSLYYSLVKISVIHLAEAMASDFRARRVPGVTALAVTPGYLRSEVMLDGFGVTEATWREAIAHDPDFARSETPYYLGRGGASLASDPNVAAKAGRTLASSHLAQEYDFTDTDGTRPSWHGPPGAGATPAPASASHRRQVLDGCRRCARGAGLPYLRPALGHRHERDGVGLLQEAGDAPGTGQVQGLIDPQAVTRLDVVRSRRRIEVREGERSLDAVGVDEAPAPVPLEAEHEFESSDDLTDGEGEGDLVPVDDGAHAPAVEEDVGVLIVAVDGLLRLRRWSDDPVPVWRPQSLQVDALPGEAGERDRGDRIGRHRRPDRVASEGWRRR